MDVASFIGSVENLTDSLRDAEATIAEVEIDLAEASGSIEETTPLLDDTVSDAEAVTRRPRSLDRRGEIERERASVNRCGCGDWRSAPVVRR